MGLKISPRKDVSYIISYQYEEETPPVIPEALKCRNDVSVSTLKNLGLARNRNHSILCAKGDIALIADDDVKYNDEYFDTIINTFENNPQTDIGLFKIKTPLGFPEYKYYRDLEYEYENVIPSASSIEIAFRTEKIKNKIFFDERFGLGSKFLNCGEEEIFLYDSLQAGLKIRYFPFFIVEHSYQSTGKNAYANVRFLRSKGAVISYVHKRSALLRIFKFCAVSSLKRKGRFIFLMKNVIRGYLYERNSRKQVSAFPRNQDIV